MPTDRERRSPAYRRRRAWLACVAGLVALWTTGALRGETPPPSRHETPLPRFEGAKLGGGRIGSSDLIGRRALVWLHFRGDPEAERVATLVKSLLPDATRANVGLLVVAVGDNAAEADALRINHGLEAPVLIDPRGDVVRKLRMEPGHSALLAIDAQGYIVGGFMAPEDPDPDLDVALERNLREVLYLDKPGDRVAPELGVLPDAPDFEVQALAGDGTLDRAALEGKVAVLVFFLPTCPHCHDTLRFLAKLSARIDRDDLVIVPVSVSANRYLVEEMAADLALPWTLYTDTAGSAARAWAHRHTVPDIAIIDRTGRVSGRHRGADSRIEALITMQVRAALGVHNPILLDRAGYSGEQFCETCHREAHTTWALTRHAYAFETLVEHGEDRNPECLPCHTVGWKQPGGYDPKTRPSHLEGVQCENCHGRGGPHQSPGFAAEVGYKRACATCHTQEHSLRFVFAERLPLISHAANREFADLSIDARTRLLARRDRRERTLFEDAPWVGSAACVECHSAEHERWSGSAHARAFDTLRAAGKHESADCKGCHTSGDSEAEAVGCESCHGPGGKHVAADAPKVGTILKLTDKCDSCVILQICGTCHDDANDPNFEFELQDKLDAIRHGFRDRPVPHT